MSRKKSGFAITSVRGGNGGGEGGDGSGSSSSPGGSRFRLVRLPGPGEALRRGRWICRDFYEREAVPRGSGRVPLSLDSPRTPPPPPFPPSSSSSSTAAAAAAAPSPHQPRSLGAFAQLVQQALPPRPPSPRPGGGTAGLSARLGLAGEEGEEEGPGSGVTAIDNKIEQAMVRFELSPAVHAGEEEEEEEGGAAPLPPLGTPTLHSSLGGAAAGASREPFDAPRAAAALLGCSFAARCAVGGAAAGAINVPPAQRLYRGLVSLAVPPPPEPRRGVPPPAAAPLKVPGPEVGALAGGAGRGSGDPWLPPPAPPESPRPLPRPPGTTFLMYRKLQQWGGA
ncbi:protein phosphatase 1 regulatory subunit 35 isoform X2 [Haliaeetus albicilla]|uniref:protein phosphatase 1 regulatory subunit 35 isoform X2 n=1 Tax=Haliaeetus albicilla TaxID=8969 RepID=UPI0037E84C3D